LNTTEQSRSTSTDAAPAGPRLQIVSDLHVEFHKDLGRGLLEKRLQWDERASAVVLAGDIGLMGRHRKTLEGAFEFFSSRFEQVFYVPGNHEFYGTRAPETVVKLRKLAGQYRGVTLFEPGVVGQLGNRRVVGATLWFRDGPHNRERSPDMSDFLAIKEFRGWVYQQNKEHLAWLEETVREGDIVVTHHLPARQSVAPRFAGDRLNVFYVCNVERLIEERQPALWIHGHTHDSCDYLLGATRVVANPYGYPNEVNPGYRPLVLEGGGL
jgi:Icc-related predicted phosphoesterase